MVKKENKILAIHYPSKIKLWCDVINHKTNWEIKFPVGVQFPTKKLNIIPIFEI